MLYQAVAQFHQSEVNGEAREIGEQLSRLTEAQRLTETALKYLPSSPYFTEQQNNTNKAFTTAKKDNDFIVSYLAAQTCSFSTHCYSWSKIVFFQRMKNTYFSLFQDELPSDT